MCVCVCVCVIRHKTGSCGFPCGPSCEWSFIQQVSSIIIYNSIIILHMV